MGKIYETLTPQLIDFIQKQQMYFVASAPLSPEGHVNVSPKGHDSFAVIDDTTVAYLDLGGSGIETMAHVRENSRLTFMFCAFEGAANILRLYGNATAHAFHTPEFDRYRTLFSHQGKARNIIVSKLTLIADSCGWGVPLYDFKAPRDQLTRYISNPKNSTEQWEELFYTANGKSIDGLPGLDRPKET